MGTCLNYWDLVYDVIMDLFCISFRIFYDQQNCMVICLNLIYNFYSSRLTPNFSRDKKLLHVFWNTLYLPNNNNYSIIFKVMFLCCFFTFVFHKFWNTWISKNFKTKNVHFKSLKVTLIARFINSMSFVMTQYQ